MTEKQYIQFFDTTLRDGEQTPGVNFNTKEKVQIALQMEKWGIDVIEAGFPISSEGDFEAVKAIAGAVKNMTVAGLARCNEKDIDTAYEALKDAADPQIHIFIATSPVHMEFKLKMSKAEVLASVAHHVAYAKSKFEKVQFSLRMRPEAIGISWLKSSIWLSKRAQRSSTFLIPLATPIRLNSEICSNI
jgi:2-isopropylmalate synthase